MKKKKIINTLGVLGITIFLFISFTSDISRATPSSTINVPPTDTICLSCLGNSISAVMKTIVKDAAKIDSISYRVKKNMQTIEHNNAEISMFLDKYEKEINELKAINKTPSDTNKTPTDTIVPTKNIQYRKKQS